MPAELSGAGDPARTLALLWRQTDAIARHGPRPTLSIDAVVTALRESNLAIGDHVRDFEHRVAELLAKRHGVMVNSGSSALRLAIDLLDLAPGDEVITPVVTFATDVAPLVQSGIVPAFVDVEPDTYQIDVDRIEEMVGPRTRAILAPNLVGNIPDWDRIRAIADRHGLCLPAMEQDRLGGAHTPAGDLPLELRPGYAYPIGARESVEALVGLDDHRRRIHVTSNHRHEWLA